MRIGFFGGTFDPPHLGHLHVAEAAAKAYRLEQILFVPTAQQPLKPQGAIAPYNDRLNMVSLLCELGPAQTNFIPSSLDAPRADGQPNYTIDTITRLCQGIMSEANLYIILGADAFLGVPNWHAGHELLGLANWIVVSRPGFQIDTSWVPLSRRKQIHILDGITYPVSATVVRDLLQHGCDCGGLLPPSIIRYAHEHSLYESASHERYPHSG